MIFPEEILATIIDNFASRRPPVLEDVLESKSSAWAPLYSDKASEQALHSLCLTSKTSRRHAIGILFHNIELTGDSIAMQRCVKRLLDIFSDANSFNQTRYLPSVSTCIRYFSVRPIHGYFPFPEDTPIFRNFEAMYESQSFLALLQVLNTTPGINIRGIYLVAPTSHPFQEKEWASLSPSLRTCIRRLIRSPQLEILCLDRISYLPHYTFNGVSAKCLSVLSNGNTISQGPENVIPEGDTEVEDARLLATLPPPTIHLLQTDHGFDFTKAPGWNGHQELKRVCSRISGLRDEPAQQAVLLATTARTLEDLKVLFTYIPMEYDDSTSFMAAFDFGQLTALKFLTLRFSGYILNSEASPHTFATLVHMLDGQACNSLQVLHLALAFHDDGEDENFLAESPGLVACLDKMDEILSSRKYPALEQFRLEISVGMQCSQTSFNDIDTQAVKISTTALVNGRFHRLKAHGVELEWLLNNMPSYES